MDQLPPKIDTKTTPFALPKATVNSIQNKRVKSMRFATKNDSNVVYIGIVIFVAFASGLIVYVLLSLSQLQKISNTNSNIPSSYTIQVSDTQDEPTTIPQTIWASREVKINNNIVWNLQLPAYFIETTTGSTDGTNIFLGEDNGNEYKLILSFPLFTNYPNGEPASLQSWVVSELSFLQPEEALTIKSESFTLNNNIDATLVFNMREIKGDSGTARTFSSKKSIVLYISKTKNRNFSKITLIPQGEYNEETARALLERIASSIKI